MREIRTSGSEGGGTEPNRPSLPLSKRFAQCPGTVRRDQYREQANEASAEDSADASGLVIPFSRLTVPDPVNPPKIPTILSTLLLLRLIMPIRRGGLPWPRRR